MKPGYKTTEFWLTVGSSVVTLIAVLLGMTATQTAELQTTVQQVVISLGGLATNLALIWRYIQSRENMKALERITQSDPKPEEPELPPDQRLVDLDD